MLLYDVVSHGNEGFKNTLTLAGLESSGTLAPWKRERLVPKLTGERA